jgi:AraC-like DNA-binding protein
MLSSAVRTFTDPDAFHAARQAEGIVTERGNFRAELTNIRLDRLSLLRSVESLSRTAYSVDDPEHFVIVFATYPGQQQLYSYGLEVTQGEIIVNRAGAEGHNRVGTACQWDSMELSHQDAAAAGYTITGRELIAPPVTHRIAPPPDLLSRLSNLHETACHLARAAPDILAKPEVGRAIDQALVEAMVACLASGDPVDERSALRHHVRVMRRLEEVVRAHPEGPLHVDDLCRTIGVSYRTLYDSCQEHLGMSPKRYLLLRRMNLVRRELRAARSDSTTVTEIATNYGFWELGRFSVVYRSLFGESPSTTLRRPHDDPRPRESGESLRQFA